MIPCQPLRQARQKSTRTGFGTAAQKNKYLSGLAKIGCLAYTEATAGSDLSLMQTKAEKQGEGYMLNGAKDLMTNAPLANAFLVLAWTDPEAGLERGTTLFLMEKGSAGLSIGHSLEILGLCGAPTAAVSFESCRVPASAIVGAVGGGYSAVQTILEYVKLALSSMSVGIGVAYLETSTVYGKTKKAFGNPSGGLKSFGHPIKATGFVWFMRFTNNFRKRRKNGN